MTDLEFNEFKQAILSSNSIDNCPKPPLPQFDDDQNYVFVSYAHNDYKAVYTDLLSFYRAGVRFWYDEGLTVGEEWDKEVEKMIQKPECAGVIFYMSENLFLSKSVIKEIRFSLGVSSGFGKNKFCINLSGVAPSKIMGNIYRSYTDEQLEVFGFDERVGELLSVFTNNTTYISKASPESDAHIANTLKKIGNQFGVIDGNGFDDERRMKELKSALEIAKQFTIEDGVLLRYLGHGGKVIIPNTVKKICNGAFQEAYLPIDLAISKSVQEIEPYAFSGCIFESLSLAEGNSVYNLIDHCLIDVKRKALVLGTEHSIIPQEGVDTIASGAFHRRRAGFWEMEIPANIKTVEDFSFYECLHLTDVTLHEGLEAIGHSAFRMTGISEIRLPKTLQTIGSLAFAECAELSEVIDSTERATIAETAFFDCPMITDQVFKDQFAKEPSSFEKAVRIP